MSLTHPILSLFTQMLAIPSPSGHEDKLAAFIKSELDKLGIPHSTDSAGNVIVKIDSQKKDAATYVFASHMDELGLVISSIEDDGTLKANKIGGLFPWKLGETAVEILGENETIPAILSMGTGHGASNDKALTWNDVSLITGLSKLELKEAGVHVGSAAVPAKHTRGPIILGKGKDPLIGAWTFDDRLGCAILLKLLESLTKEEIKLEFSLLVAFTTQEEIGGNGAKFLCNVEQPDVFVAIDGSPIPENSDLSLDGRPALWAKDRLCYYDVKLNQAFAQAALEANTEAVYVSHEFAASDASLIKYAGGAGRVVCFGHVRANSHGFEVTRLSSLDNVFNTVMAFLRSSSL